MIQERKWIWKNIKYNILIEEDDTNYIAENLINIINNEMNEQANLMKIKINPKKKKKYSDELLEKIERKNRIYKEYKDNNENESKI